MTAKVYELVTNAIIEQLEKVQANDWRKPWFNIGSSPMNAISKKSYRGINTIMLSNKPYNSNLYASFKQWKEKDCTVNKGEKGHVVVFWNFGENEDTNGDKHSFAYCKHYYVFNSEQVTGDWAREQETNKAKLNPNEIHENAQRICDYYLANERIKLGISDRACYSPSEDRIQMPLIGQFKSNEDFYSTFFHEIGHSTGKDTRLKRDLTGRFGSSDYAQEELVAEFTAAMLCGSIALSQTPRLDHAQYIANWLQRLKSDKTYAIKAASQAQKAVDFVNAAVENYEAFLIRQQDERKQA